MWMSSAIAVRLKSQRFNRLFMPTVLLTLCGPERSVDLEIPGDTPISQLGRLLTETAESKWAGPASSSTLQRGLGAVNGTLLPPNCTLVDCGVFDGAVLVLQNDGVWVQQLSTEGAAARAQIDLDPQVSDTGGIGIRWNKEGLLP
jgi:WXG100 protein secretion system (Wss), protein YukD